MDKEDVFNAISQIVKPVKQITSVQSASITSPSPIPEPALVATEAVLAALSATSTTNVSVPQVINYMSLRTDHTASPATFPTVLPVPAPT